MEDALVHSKKTTIMNYKNVLILVLMEDALVRSIFGARGIRSS